MYTIIIFKDRFLFICLSEKVEILTLLRWFQFKNILFNIAKMTVINQKDFATTPWVGQQILNFSGEGRSRKEEYCKLNQN